MPDAGNDAPVKRLIVEKDGAIGRVKMDNQTRRNAMTLGMWQDLGKAIEDFAADDNIRVVIVSGEGGKAFCAGADISEFEKNRSSEESVKIYNEAVERSSDLLRTIDKPTIAAIEGFCVGGGVGIATCCDMRIATDDSIIAIPAAKLGLGYRVDGLKPLVDIIGPSYSMELFYTARKFTADEAERMNYFNRVIPRGEFDAYIADYAATIAGNAPLTIKAVKVVVKECLKDDSDRDHALCASIVDDCFKSEDYIEGRRAFMEKRKAEFKGR
ncbi:enoyl-CoA hydratase [Thalassospiraceae bacterium LMO-JJ14]|nr:enoyl-CoA hydratase [Thalassospiraceae bacterium LMO-JJ14]